MVERRTRDRKGRGFDRLLNGQEYLLLRSQLSVLTLVSIFVPPPCSF